ncbi:2-dehydro-3-deoxygalactonokinase [Paenibacillus sp. B01]|uniref:2-dehydro-3-deoxygalactonokinase n=1 Tax=Paenibacillus sp. B01 TaxID=2660554 RepID=UPI0018918BDB|nr:2-dehydro-3-deoxygalactonokinase [Paenibacillus sp. B01]
MKVIVIDCGTTNCRMRLLDDDRLLASVTKQTGAGDAAQSGSNSGLKRALRDSYEELAAAEPDAMKEVRDIVASGMITSSAGLMEIEHLMGPINLSELIGSIRRYPIPELFPQPVLFVPGVKFLGAESANHDMIRGEETELFGFLEVLTSGNEVNKERLFMHYGSHHKWIRTRERSIISSSTSISGELMMAVMNHTLLRDNTLHLEDVVPDPDWVRKGVEAVKQYGAGRALFQVRTLNVLDKQDKQASTSFFLGVIAGQDLAMLTEEMLYDVEEIVLYGRNLFPSIVVPILKDVYPSIAIRVVPEEESGWLSVYGAASLYRQYKEEMKGC